MEAPECLVCGGRHWPGEGHRVGLEAAGEVADKLIDVGAVEAQTAPTEPVVKPKKVLSPEHLAKLKAGRLKAGMKG